MEHGGVLRDQGHPDRVWQLLTVLQGTLRLQDQVAKEQVAPGDPLRLLLLELLDLLADPLPQLVIGRACHQGPRHVDQGPGAQLLQPIPCMQAMDRRR